MAAAAAATGGKSSTDKGEDANGDDGDAAGERAKPEDANGVDGDDVGERAKADDATLVDAQGECVIDGGADRGSIFAFSSTNSMARGLASGEGVRAMLLVSTKQALSGVLLCPSMSSSSSSSNSSSES